MQAVLTLRGRTALLAALAALALPSRALDFGEVEVLSAIGEKLDARIPLRAAPGEWFHVTCIALTPAPGAGLPAPLADGVVSVERRSRSSNLRVRTATPVNEPALAFGVTSRCAGDSQAVTREFSLLIDPPRVARAPVERARVRPAAIQPDPSFRVLTPRDPAPTRAAPRPMAAAPGPAAATPSRTKAEPAPLPAPAAPATPSPRGSDFVLRLSSAPIDMTRSRNLDEKTRAMLRERLRLLDSDDQVAAVLALRDNMQRLEARVAELQLKLATTPPAIVRADPPAASPPPAPAPGIATPEAKAPAPVAKAEAPAPKAEALVPKAEAPAPKTEAPVPKVEAPVQKIEAPAKTDAQAPKPAPAKSPVVSAPASTAEEVDWRRHWPWLAGLALLIVVVAAAAAWIKKRRAASDGAGEAEDSKARVVMDPPTLTRSAIEHEQPIEVAAPIQPAAPAPKAATAADKPADDPAEALRRRYIEERFPEIRDRTIVLDDPGSVVKGARLFYEDGALPRAVELLRFAIEDRPDAIRPWLALFEIYRLERLTGEYAELAARFRDRHGASDKWEKVRAFGREIDPGNALYQDPPASGLETIGPREARRRAQGSADPIAENWLEAPMDFENEVFATELRRSLMARGSIEERDLVANPMPALRSVEMFSVG